MLTPSTEQDLEQLNEWILHDPYHFHQGQPEWWLTGNDNLLAFCLSDDTGPLCYVRLDSEDGYVRIHTQFAPESVVSKKRLVVGMIGCMSKLIEFYKESAKGMIFNSVSPSLVAFMDTRFGFKACGNDDYVIQFEAGELRSNDRTSVSLSASE